MTDETYLKRCLELAQLGMGKVSPNPMVGCVIVTNGKIIGEGYHAEFGKAHAEVNAIQSVLEHYGDEAEDLLKQATVYVSLEPCAHFGKTPPCADLLVKHRVKKVVVGNIDPFSGVDGKGIKKLKNAGIDVVSGVFQDECSAVNRRFFTRIQKNRPYIILKWAQTENGYFAPNDGSQQWISGSLAKKMVHQWRSEEDAVLVGKQTAMIDNPALTVREWPGRNPIRLVIDKDLKIPHTSLLYNKDAKTIVFNHLKTSIEENIHFIQMEDMQYYLPQKIAYQLYLMDIQSVIVEGGANLLNQFIEAGLWDEARVFTVPKLWNNGLLAPIIHGKIITDNLVENDNLKVYLNTLN